jgi:hypothetical protein
LIQPTNEDIAHELGQRNTPMAETEEEASRIGTPLQRILGSLTLCQCAPLPGNSILVGHMAVATCVSYFDVEVAIAMFTTVADA